MLAYHFSWLFLACLSRCSIIFIENSSASLDSELALCREEAAFQLPAFSPSHFNDANVPRWLSAIAIVDSEKKEHSRGISSGMFNTRSPVDRSSCHVHVCDVHVCDIHVCDVHYCYCKVGNPLPRTIGHTRGSLAASPGGAIQPRTWVQMYCHNGSFSSALSNSCSSPHPAVHHSTCLQTE